MNITLLILAGGRGTRFGLLNTVLPKSALPVYDESTLARNVRQARAAGFKEIIVSTRASFLKSVCGMLEAAGLTGPGACVKVVANRRHGGGALPALLHLLNGPCARRVALSLSDIFFIENPYRRLHEHGQLDGTHLAVADPFDRAELSKGGIVICDAGRRVRSVMEAPLAGNTEGVRWTGAAVFDRALKRQLGEFIARGRGHAPLGDFFEHCRAEGEELRAFRVSDFINVNTPDDMFMASLYRALEFQRAEGGAGRGLREAASSFRRRLLRGRKRAAASAGAGPLGSNA